MLVFFLMNLIVKVLNVTFNPKTPIQKTGKMQYHAFLPKIFWTLDLKIF